MMVAAAVLTASVASAQDRNATAEEGPRTVRELVTRLFKRDAKPADQPVRADRALIAGPAPQAAPESAPKQRAAVANVPPPTLPRPRVAPFAEIAAKATAQMPAALAIADRIGHSGDPAARRVDSAFAALETIAGPLDRVGASGALLAYGPAPSAGNSDLVAASVPAASQPNTVRPPRNDIEALIDRHAREKGVPLDLARGLIFVLSTNNPRATGAAGEIGLMQISPKTARGIGYSGAVENLYDPDTNLHWGMKYLAEAQSRGDGTACETLLRYSAGIYATTMTDGARKFCAKVKTAIAARN